MAYLREDSEQHEPGIIAKFTKLTVNVVVSIFVRLVYLRHGSSIAVLFVCENRTGLKNLHSLYISGELQSLLEDIFTSLLVADDPQVTRVHVKKLVWEPSDYCRCFQYFYPLPERKLFIFVILCNIC